VLLEPPNTLDDAAAPVVAELAWLYDDENDDDCWGVENRPDCPPVRY
jgi:hypothetical protein